MKSSSLPRYVPWIDWEEWLHVYNGCYSEKYEFQKNALEIISLWRLRGKVPHSVESTALILEAILMDPLVRLSNSFERSDHQLRSLYSFAIIRTVNGLVDQLQQGYYADSIYNLASRMNLPGWIVEIRHDSTHNEIPSLVVLRSAILKLFQWLQDQYWAPQYNYLKTITKTFIDYNCCDKRYEMNKQSMHEINKNFEAIIANPSHSMITQLLLPLVADIFEDTKIQARNLSANSYSDISIYSTNEILIQWKRTLIRISENFPSIFVLTMYHILNIVVESDMSSIFSMEDNTSHQNSKSTHDRYSSNLNWLRSLIPHILQYFKTCNNHNTAHIERCSKLNQIRLLSSYLHYCIKKLTQDINRCNNDDDKDIMKKSNDSSTISVFLNEIVDVIDDLLRGLKSLDKDENSKVQKDMKDYEQSLHLSTNNVHTTDFDSKSNDQFSVISSSTDVKTTETTEIICNTENSAKERKRKRESIDRNLQKISDSISNPLSSSASLESKESDEEEEYRSTSVKFGFNIPSMWKLYNIEKIDENKFVQPIGFIPSSYNCQGLYSLHVLSE